MPIMRPVSLFRKELIMPSKSQFTGMRGVYLVAAELSRRGFVASPTSRSARGADILVTDEHCRHTWSVQVKTNARTFGHWLLNPEARKMVSPSHLYVFVNLKKDGADIEYFVVPSKRVARTMDDAKIHGVWWHGISLAKVRKYKDRWDLLSKHSTT